MIDEQAWILQAQQGSDEAFTCLVETYQKPVYNLCYRMLGEPEAAEDAAQDTFLKAYQNLTRYDIERPFATWLLSIAAHHCIDKLRRKRFSSFSLDADEDGPVELPDRSARTLKGRRSANRTRSGCTACCSPWSRSTGQPSSCATGRTPPRSRSPRRSN